MNRYLRYLGRVFIMTFGALVHYRADFVLRIVRAGAEVTTTLIVVSAFYAQTPSIIGWDKYEALTVFAFYYLISSIVLLVFGQGIDNLFQDILSGQFDRYLVMPIDSQVAAGTRFIFITNVFRMLFDAGLLVYAVSHLSLQLMWHEWLLVVVSSLSGAVVYYSIMFAASILSFWTFSGEAPFLMHTMASAARYPIDFFSRGLRLAFHFIPLAFIAYVPASVLLGRHHELALFSPLVAGICLWLSRQLWKAGLRSYSSASS